MDSSYNKDSPGVIIVEIILATLELLIIPTDSKHMDIGTGEYVIKDITQKENMSIDDSLLDPSTIKQIKVSMDINTAKVVLSIPQKKVYFDDGDRGNPPPKYGFHSGISKLLKLLYTHR